MAKVIITATGVFAHTGKHGKAVYRQHGEDTVLARRPRAPRNGPTESQLTVRKRFRLAAYYGRHADEDPATRALYERAAGIRGESVHSVAMQDYLAPPSIEEFDLERYSGKPGDRIYIVALDDHMVDELDVEVTDEDGALIEKGSAVKEFEGWWVYAATADVPTGTTVRVIATARDLPGSKGKGEAAKTV